jgi:hypothetical protein
MEVDGYPVLDPFVKYMELDWKGKLDLGHLNWLADFNEEETLFSAFILAFSGAWDDSDVAENVATASVNHGVSVDAISNNQQYLTKHPRLAVSAA